MNTTVANIWDFVRYLALKIGNGLFELMMFIITFFAPAGYVLGAVGFAILVDTYFGRWRAKHKKEKVTSKITRVSITNKSIGYMLVVLGAFLMDKAFMNEIVGAFFNVEFAVTKMVGLVFCWIEYTSVDESYTAVKGKSLGQALKDLLKKVKIVKGEIDELKKDKDAGE